MRTFSKTIFTILFAVIIVGSLFGVRIVAAQGYVPLAPIAGLNVTNTNCANEDVATQASDSGCQTNVTSFVQNAVKYIIIIAGVLAVIMIVIGGVQYASSDAISGKSDGKTKIQNAIYGLVLALAAFVILQSIDPNILNLNLDLSLPASSAGTANTTTAPITNANGCPTGLVPSNGVCIPGLSTTPNNSTTALTTTSGSAWPPASVATLNSGLYNASDQTIRAGFAALNPPVTVKNNEPDCKTVGQQTPPCISLDGLSSGATNGLAALSQDAVGATNVAIVITGGTEYWEHCVPESLSPTACADATQNSTMHEPGKGAVDISSNSTGLDSVIATQGSKTSSTSNGCENTSLQVYSLNNATYVQEVDTSSLGYHWHVCYGP